MRKLLVMAGLVALAGCADPVTAPDQDQSPAELANATADRSGFSDHFPGEYTLESVNGRHLPFTFVDVPNALDLKQELLGGELTLRPNGTFALTSHFRDTQSGDVHEYATPQAGDYASAGLTLRFVETLGYPFPGSMQANRLVVEYRGFTLSFFRSPGSR